MHKIIIMTLALLTGLNAAAQPELYLNIPDSVKITSHKVKGRQGLLIHQKLQFDAYQTGKVKRSWTRGFSYDWAQHLAPTWASELSLTDNSKKQHLRFEINDRLNHSAEVMCFKNVEWNEVTVRNAHHIVNVLGNLMPGIHQSENTYDVDIRTSDKELWSMHLDMNEALVNAKNYTGLFIANDSTWYKIIPVTHIRNKKGAAVKLPLGGSVGFSFSDKEGRIVSAVASIDAGKVYFIDNLPPNRKLVLAAAMAALLLQQEIDE